MQPEEKKFLTVNTIEAWKQGFAENIEITPDGALKLWSVPNLKAPSDVIDLNFPPAGMAFKRPDTLFIIDKDSGALYRYNTVTKKIEPVLSWTSKENVVRQFLNPGGLAVSDTMLYVADSGHHRVQALFLYNYQVRFILGAVDQCNHPTAGDSAGAFNNPTDVVLDAGGNIYVVDQGNKRVQKFNKCGRYLTQFGADILTSPINIGIDNEGFVYVLDKAQQCVIKFDSEGNVKDDDFNLTFDVIPSGLAVDSKQKLYIGEEANGDHQKIHVFDQRGRYLGACPGYRGPSTCLDLDRQDNLYVGFYDKNRGRLAVLNSGETFIRSGTYYSNVFDSTKEDCRWHRLALDVDIPPKTRLEIYSYFSNEFKGMQEIRSLPSSSWGNAVISPEDALFQDGSGRYLWLRIRFYGDEYHTPVLKGLTVYFPRMSYLRYLPAIYQENAVSRDFVERFLVLFETFFSETEETIASIARYYDPFATDSEFIPWLATWLAIAVDENWAEEKTRQFIARAYNFFKKRGTREGLEEIITLYTGQKPVIIEHYNYMEPMIVGKKSALGLHTVLGKKSKTRLLVESRSIIGEFALREKAPDPGEPFKHYAYDFTLVLNTSHLNTEAQLTTLQRIVEEEKPAHTRCCLRTVGTGMRIGLDSFVGVGTIVAKKPPSMRLGVKTVVGKNTILRSDKHVQGEISVNSRIGIGSILN
jgi:phage tail-like protein